MAEDHLNPQVPSRPSRLCRLFCFSFNFLGAEPFSFGLEHSQFALDTVEIRRGFSDGGVPLPAFLRSAGFGSYERVLDAQEVPETKPGQQDKPADGIKHLVPLFQGIRIFLGKTLQLFHRCERVIVIFHRRFAVLAQVRSFYLPAFRGDAGLCPQHIRFLMGFFFTQWAKILNRHALNGIFVKSTFHHPTRCLSFGQTLLQTAAERAAVPRLAPLRMLELAAERTASPTPRSLRPCVEDGGRQCLDQSPTTTMQDNLREKVLAPYSEQSEYGGIRYFRGVPLNVLQQLITHGLVEMGRWNDCPGVAAAFLPFLKAHPECTAHGYAVSPERPDSRVTIEGIEKAGRLTKEEVIDFANTFRSADEIELTGDYARCWYD